jgi:hypothetical protein
LRSRAGLALVITSLLASSCVAAFPVLSAEAAPTLGVWSMATAPSPTGSWYAVDYGDGHFVAVGHGADVAVSVDGATWVEQAAPDGSWRALTYGDGEFLALSSASASAEEMVSTNGVNWTTRTGPTGPWTSVAYGGGRFVAVSSNGQIATSTDGVQWSVAWRHKNYDLASVAYGAGRFVATDTAMGATIISSNGVDWSRILPLKAGEKWGAVAYGNGNFVQFDGSGSGYIATSVYGYVWALHSYAPAQDFTDATFGCGEFVAAGQSTGTTNDFFSSPTASSWSTASVPMDSTSDWSGVAYGAHRFVAVDTAGNIAWSSYPTDCAAAIPSAPRQVSGNVRSGEVWTYMHPSLEAGGARVSSYGVTVTNGTVTKTCVAPVSFQPNCIIRGLANREVYWVTTQAHNRFGDSVTTDPEFVIPVASPSFSAETTQRAIAQSGPVVVQVTGVVANSEGIYPTSVVTVHFGSSVEVCHPNPFGECLITIHNPPPGPASIYATYTGYGRSYRSATFHVTITS